MGKMSRNKGYRWELDVRKYFDRWLNKRTVAGTDLPDVELVVAGMTIVVECKNQATLDWPAWLRQVEVDRRRVNADVGVVVAKRRGKAMVQSSYVMMTGDDFTWLLEQLDELAGR